MPGRQLKETARRLAGYFETQPGVDAALVFGSLARGEEHPRSDVDVAVLLDRALGADPLLGMRIASELMGVLGRSDVDVVVLNHAPPLLQHRVVRDGHVVFARSNAVLAEFTIRAFQRFVDTQPLRDLQAQRLRERVLEDHGGQVGGRR